MWGFGGKHYWGRRETVREGIVVIFAWMSNQERHFNNYVELYSSLGWNSLVCHSQFLNFFRQGRIQDIIMRAVQMNLELKWTLIKVFREKVLKFSSAPPTSIPNSGFFPEKAEALAFDIINGLNEELKMRPCPLVFASFSGGPKACMYKVVQIIDGKCDTRLNSDDCRILRDCISGHIYDSSPVDFTSDLGRQFVVHPPVLKMSRPPRVLSWMANGISNGLDALFLTRFESQRAEYWQTLYSSVSMGAPYLIFCSESDELASYQVICNFAQRIRELGGDVKLVTMRGSPHVGHFRIYPGDYKAAVTELLGKAAAVYSQRIRRLEGEGMGVEGTDDEISESMYDLRKRAANPNQSFRGVTIQPSDHFYTPSSVSCYEDRGAGSLQDEQKEGLIHLPTTTPPTINAHGVLGQILFDVCVPKNIEEWDVKLSKSLSRGQYNSTCPFNPMKRIRRSRL